MTDFERATEIKDTVAALNRLVQNAVCEAGLLVDMQITPLQSMKGDIPLITVRVVRPV